MRELLRAVMLGKPIITIVEPEMKHGGITFQDAVKGIECALDRLNEWGLAAEVKLWQEEEHLGELPTAQEIVDALFKCDDGLVLEWNRVKVRALT